jgi:hypothetical protein
MNEPEILISNLMLQFASLLYHQIVWSKSHVCYVFWQRHADDVTYEHSLVLYNFQPDLYKISEV